jgi:hypothetical protein
MNFYEELQKLKNDIKNDMNNNIENKIVVEQYDNDYCLITKDILTTN